MFKKSGEYDASNFFVGLLFRSSRIKCIRSGTQSCAASKFRRTGCASVDNATGRGVFVDAVLFILLFEHTFKSMDGGGEGKMSRISIEEVKHVANLARLAVTEDEAKMFQQQLDAIISFAEQLNELDTENVVPTSHVLSVKNVMREDVAKEGLPVEEVLKNAPDAKDGQFRVPSIIE